MVDPIGTKAVSTSDRRIAPAARIATAPLAARVAGPQDQGVVAVSHDLAASPPVDLDRVTRLRQSIADGSYTISPAQIADRLIALKTEWQA